MMSLITNTTFNEGGGGYSQRVGNNQNDMQTYIDVQKCINVEKRLERG